MSQFTESNAVDPYQVDLCLLVIGQPVMLTSCDVEWLEQSLCGWHNSFANLGLVHTELLAVPKITQNLCSIVTRIDFSPDTCIEYPSVCTKYSAMWLNSGFARRRIHPFTWRELVSPQVARRVIQIDSVTETKFTQINNLSGLTRIKTHELFPLILNNIILLTSVTLQLPL